MACSVLCRDAFYVLNKILEKYSPRIIVCEYNATHLPHEDKVVLRDTTDFQGNYFGASILSFYKLGIKHITKNKDCNTYRFQIIRQNNYHTKCFKTLEECIEYKDNYLANIN